MAKKWRNISDIPALVLANERTGETYGPVQTQEEPQPTTSAAAEIYALIEAGEIPESVSRLRGDDTMAMRDLATVLGRLGEVSGAAILVEAAPGVLADPTDPNALHQLGYACADVGLDEVAIRPLRAGLAAGPDLGIARELAITLQTVNRDAEAVAVLRSHEHLLQPWPDRYLLAHSQLLSGDIPAALATADRLETGTGDVAAMDRGLRLRLTRAQAAGRISPLDARDLCGWQFVQTGTLLTTLSPFGVDTMNGRWAYVSDTYEQCALGIHRLRMALATAGLRPRQVCVLPDRNSLILGLAVAQLMGLPAVRFEAAPESLVVAYDLAEVDNDLGRQLVQRQPRQVLSEHATDWVDGPPITADITTLLHQVVMPQWGVQLRAHGREVTQLPADERPVERIADQIARTAPTVGVGDDDAPRDDEELLQGFIQAVRETWLQGPRSRPLGRGPVFSARFG